MIDPKDFDGFSLDFERDGSPEYGDPPGSAYYILGAPDLSYCGLIRLTPEQYERFKGLFQNPSWVPHGSS